MHDWVTSTSQTWRRLLKQHRAIAVIRASDLELGIAMATAVAQGGIKLIEITWNSDRPHEIIHQLRTQLPDCIIGTGTILTHAQLDEAIASGVQFCFTPHVNLKLIQTALNASLPIIPGALTPTEIVTAWQAGASCVKVYPVQALGGVDYIKSLQPPLGQIPLIPTGGVTLDNAVDFLRAGAIAVGLAGELFPTHLIQSQDWSQIAGQAAVLTQNLAQFNELLVEVGSSHSTL